MKRVLAATTVRNCCVAAYLIAVSGMHGGNVISSASGLLVFTG